MFRGDPGLPLHEKEPEEAEGVLEGEALADGGEAVAVAVGRNEARGVVVPLMLRLRLSLELTLNDRERWAVVVQERLREAVQDVAESVGVCEMARLLLWLLESVAEFAPETERVGVGDAVQLMIDGVRERVLPVAEGVADEV